MKLSLAELMLVPIAFIVSWFLFGPIAFEGYRPRPIPNWARAAMQVGDLRDSFAELAQHNLTGGDINDWLNDVPPTTDVFNDIPWLGQKRDPWNNHLVCVERQSSGNSTSDANRTELHFYSLGRDGMTRSNGNDDDDISSWDASCEFYLAEEYALASAKYQKHSLIYATLFFPFVLIALIWCARRIKRTA